jgi:hypothetical protein
LFAEGSSVLTVLHEDLGESGQNQPAHFAQAQPEIKVFGRLELGVVAAYGLDRRATHHDARVFQRAEQSAAAASHTLKP